MFLLFLLRLGKIETECKEECLEEGEEEHEAITQQQDEEEEQFGCHGEQRFPGGGPIHAQNHPRRLPKERWNERPEGDAR